MHPALRAHRCLEAWPADPTAGRHTDHLRRRKCSMPESEEGSGRGFFRVTERVITPSAVAPKRLSYRCLFGVKRAKLVSLRIAHPPIQRHDQFVTLRVVEQILNPTDASQLEPEPAGERELPAVDFP